MHADSIPSKKPFEVRIAGKHDVPAMIPIINHAFAIEDFLEGERTNPQRMAEMMQTGEFLLAEDSHGKIAACVYAEVKEDRGYFGMLSVEPSRQGSGLGRMMIEAAENYCRRRKCASIWILVLNLRPDLPPLYRKFGYIETGTEKFQPQRKLKPGVDCYAIKMEKELD